MHVIRTASKEFACKVKLGALHFLEQSKFLNISHIQFAWRKRALRLSVKDLNPMFSRLGLNRKHAICKWTPLAVLGPLKKLMILRRH